MKDLKQQFIRTFIIGAVLLSGIAILVNMIFNNLNFGRFDLTAEQVYKLSPSVKKILSQLEAPIELTYYVSSSEKMPTTWKNLERDVIDKLKELQLASAGKLTYTVFDPSAEEEKEAVEADKEEAKESDIMQQQKPKPDRKKIAEKLYEKGVAPFGVQSTERDEFAVKRIYSSIVLSYLDRKEDVIDQVRPEMFGNLEYEIMARIYKLISNKQPKIGFFPSDPEMPPQYRQQFMQQRPPDQYTSAVELLQNAGYNVVRTNIKADDPIPDDIQTMVVMADQPLNDRQLYEIDRLVHDGVRLIVAGQSYNYQIMPSRGGAPGTFDVMAMPTQVNLNKLLRSYGVEIGAKIFMDRSSAYIQIPTYRTRRMGIFQVQEQAFEPVTKPVIIKINAEDINTNVSISNKISELFYLYGSNLNILDEIVKKDTLQETTLFTSSNYSWTTESFGYAPVNTSEPASDAYLKHQPLGVFLEGKFASPNLDKDAPAWPATPGSDEEPAPETSAEKIEGPAKPNKIICYGNANMFKNDVIGAVDSHKSLLLNSVDALTLGDDLIHIRSKNIVARRVKETSPAGKAVTKAFVIWFPALVFIFAGIYLNIKRRK
ncbi:GldG family protein [candidate division KSB1 bacterium]|nr:GldG family protein [candidate division KSB1 bacterium]